MKKLINIINQFPKLFPEVSLSNNVNHGKLFFHTALVTAIEIALVVLFLPIIFETDDDALMNSIVSGAISGQPSEFIIFSNILIGKALKSMYLAFPSVNWYTWHFLLVFFLGYTSIQYSFAKIKSAKWEKVIRHLFIFSLLFFSLVILQFTRIASIAIIGGLCLMLFSNKQKPVELILAIVLILWGALIRHHVILMFAYMAIPLILYLIVKKRFAVLSVITVSFILANGLNNYHQNQYNKFPGQKTHKQFISTAASIYVHNNPNFKFKENSAVAEKLGWNKADTKIAAQSNLDVGHPKFSKKKLAQVLKNKRNLKEKVQEGYFFSALTQTVKQFIKYLSQTYMAAFYILLVVLLIHFNNKQRIIFLLLVAYIFALAFALYFVKNGIPKARVIFGLITPVFLWALAQFKIEKLSRQFIYFSKIIPAHLIQKGFIALAVLSVILPVAAYGRQVPSIKKQITKAQNVHQKILVQNDEFCAAWTDIRSFPLFEQPYSYEKIYRLGWIAGSPSNKQKIEKYTGKEDVGIYSIFNKDIKWYFNPHYYHKFAENIENFYLTNYENCRFDKDTLLTTQKDTVFKLTFFIQKNDGNGNDTIQ